MRDTSTVEIAAFLALHGSRMCRELDASRLNLSHSSCSICVKHRTAGCPALKGVMRTCPRCSSLPTAASASGCEVGTVKWDWI